MQTVLELTKALVSLPSITPNDASCQSLLSNRLEAIGFTTETLVFNDVTNLWAKRGKEQPLLVFVGHTDVVPPGPLDKWQSDPFKPEIRDGYLFGRGAADMKGSLAAMLVACERFITKHPEHRGSIAWLITSDEEGPSVNGTARVVETLKTRGEKIEWCLVGEPSSNKQLGDIIKIGRRGSLSGDLTILGKQGHIAYPHLAENPIHKALPALAQLTAIEWDKGNAFFPPTSLQISNINSGTGATNVIPGELKLQFNFRYSTEVTTEKLQQTVKHVLDTFSLNYTLDWHHSGLPFLTQTGELVTAATEAIEQLMQITPTLSTSGGTSDGRFIAPLGAQVVELGPCNATIHQVNECVAVDDLEKLALIYQLILEKLLAK